MPATTKPPQTRAKELAALDRMTTAELREKFATVFGEPTTAGNRAWLARRVGWRLQTLAEGELSDRAQAWAAEAVRAGTRAKKKRPAGPPAGGPARGSWYAPQRRDHNESSGLEHRA